MKKIGARLTVTLAVVALLAGVTTAGGILWSVHGQFSGYRAQQGDRRVEEILQFLGAYYQARGTWDGIAAILSPSHHAMWSGMHQMHAETGLHDIMPGMMALMDLGAERVAIATQDGRTVADSLGQVGAPMAPSDLAKGLPIRVNDQQVGTLVLERPAVPPLSQLDRSLVSRLTLSALLSGLGAAILAGVLGLFLARRITVPLRGLTQAASHLALRDLSVRVGVAGEDEIAELGNEFNRMAGQLEQQEQLRRSMISDVAHELRTPVTYLRSQFEAMQDGVAEPNLETLLPMHDEVLRLSRLLDDLQALSLADAGQLPLHRVTVQPEPIMEAIAATFGAAAEAKEIHFELEVVPNLPDLRADTDRLKQVILNLLGNALRHTPEGGRIELRVAPAPSGIAITVADTGEGISPEDLPHVFDRFYRADKSRSRAGGGSGLGLAIAKGIVKAHGGSIHVESQVGVGSRFTILLPASDQT